MVNRWLIRAAVFSGLFLLVMALAIGGSSLPIEETILHNFYSASTSFGDHVFTIVTAFGDPLVALLLAVVLMSWLLYRRQKLQAIVIGLILIGSTVLGSILKLIFERNRPDLWTQLVTESSFSFPSGHALASISIAAAALYMLRSHSHYRLVFALLAGYVALVGISRLYLGVHYPTDIIGGWLAGLAWYCIVRAAVTDRREQNL